MRTRERIERWTPGFLRDPVVLGFALIGVIIAIAVIGFRAESTRTVVDRQLDAPCVNLTSVACSRLLSKQCGSERRCRHFVLNQFHPHRHRAAPPLPPGTPSPTRTTPPPVNPRANPSSQTPPPAPAPSPSVPPTTPPPNDPGGNGQPPGGNPQQPVVPDPIGRLIPGGCHVNALGIRVCGSG